jgi:hypothetical protein
MTAMVWIRDRALTLTLMAMFLLFLGGQLLTGFAEYNSEQAAARSRRGDHARTISPPVTCGRPSSRIGRASSCRWRCSSC